jgi:hypothetical protein
MITHIEEQLSFLLSENGDKQQYDYRQSSKSHVTCKEQYEHKKF